MSASYSHARLIVHVSSSQQGNFFAAKRLGGRVATKPWSAPRILAQRDSRNSLRNISEESELDLTFPITESPAPKKSLRQTTTRQVDD